MSPRSTRLRRALLLGFLIGHVLTVRSSAQDLDARDALLLRYSLRHWSDEEGLPSKIINTALHTRDGFLWLGTHQGIARFDGRAFEVFDHSTVPNWSGDQVNSLLEDVQGRLWIASNGGLLVYDRREPVPAHAFRLFSEADGLVESPVRTLAETSDGTIWIGTYGGGLFRARGDRIDAPFGVDDGLTDPNIWQVLATRDGSLWIGTNDGLFRLQNGAISSFGDLLPDPTIRGLAEAPDGSIWVATSTAGIVHLRDGAVVRRLSKADGLMANSIMLLRVDDDGGLWIGTTGGVHYLQNGRLEHLYMVSEDNNGVVRDLTFGPRGLLWISMDDGLYQLKPHRVERLTVADGLSEKGLFGVFEDRSGSLWFGTHGGGVSIQRDSSWTYLQQAQGLTAPSVYGFAEDPRGSIWISSVGQGLYRATNGVVDGHWTARDGLPSDVVRALLVDRQGVLWIGTNNGISQMGPDGLRTPEEAGDWARGLTVALHESRDGALWIATFTGLIRRHGDSTRVFTDADGLTDQLVFDIHESVDGTLWFGTRSGGLIRFRDGRLRAFRVSDGLPADDVNAILEDDDGNLWLSSSRGIFSVSIAELEAYDRGERERLHSLLLDRSDGLPSVTSERGFMRPAVKRRDGRLVFTTDAGATVIDPRRVAPIVEDTPLFIDRVRVNGHPVQLDGARLVLDHDDRIEIAYVALSFSAPNQLAYRHRLEGHDDAWVPAQTRDVAFYNNLPAGHYTFLVAATNADNRWSATPARLSIVVRPPFWAKPWFLLLATAACIGLIFLGGRYASSRQLRRHVRALETERRLHAERERISRDLHDNVGAQLSNIISGLELIRLSTKAGELDAAGEYLESLDTDAHETIRQLRETIWAIHQDHVSVASFRDQLQQYLAVQTRYRNGTQTHLTAEGNLDAHLSPMQALNLYRIAQEAIHNALKHACADHLHVSLIAGDEALELAVRDDGTFVAGRDEERHYGLEGMRRRARDLGSELDLRVGDGTTVIVRVAFSTP